MLHAHSTFNLFAGKKIGIPHKLIWDHDFCFFKVENVVMGAVSSLSADHLKGGKANNMKLPYVIGPRRDGDLPAFWADATKAKELLGWEAKYGVEEMCKSSWKFAKGSV